MKQMKHFILSFIINFAVIALNAQSCLLLEKSFGGSAEEGIFGYIDVIEEIGVGYVVFTVSRSDDGDVNSNSGNLDGWIYKTDYDGNIIWSKTFGAEGDDYIYSAIKDNDGNYVAVGGTNSSSGSFSSNHGQDDMWAVKIDPSGNLIWNKLLGGTQSDYAYNIILDDIGNYILAGFSRSINGDVGGNNGFLDVWVVKLNDLGSIIWEENYGGSELDLSWDLINDSFSNNTLLIGYSYSQNGDVSNGHYSGDIWVQKIDNNGALLWEKSYGGLNFEQAFKGVQLNNGNYILVGTSSSSNIDIENGNNGDLDAAVVIIDSIGNLLSFKNYGGLHFDMFNNIIPISTTETVFFGSSMSSNEDLNNNYGDHDLWYAKINNNTGVVIESQNIGGSKEDAGAFASLNSNNNFIVFCTSSSIDFDVLSRTDDSQGDTWMFEFSPGLIYSNTISILGDSMLTVDNAADSYQWIDCSNDNAIITGETSKDYSPSINGSYASIVNKGNCTDTTNCVDFVLSSITEFSNNSLINIYPNPIGSSEYLMIETDVKILDITLFNSLGIEVSDSKVENEELSINELSNGVYYLHLETNEGLIIKKFLKI